jgi:hypothetical protein
MHACNPTPEHNDDILKKKSAVFRVWRSDAIFMELLSCDLFWSSCQTSLSLALALIVCICVIRIIDAWVRFRDAVQGWDFCGIWSRESLETSIIFFIVLEWKTSSLRYLMFLISSSSSSLPLFAPQWDTYSSFFIKALYDCSVDVGGVC